MTNSKIKKILSTIEEIKNKVNANDQVASKKKKMELNTKILKVLEKTLKYLEEK